ncbi:hypothetical protein J7E62_09335 [Variovorax paradoxus]|nr:hypothetical protein [Variovorax paradoxus]
MAAYRTNRPDRARDFGVTSMSLALKRTVRSPWNHLMSILVTRIVMRLRPAPWMSAFVLSLVLVLLWITSASARERVSGGVC